MKAARLARGLLFASLSATLAACAGAPAPRLAVNDSGLPFSTARGALRSGDYLYVTAGLESGWEASVYTYPKLKALGLLGTFGTAGAECADASGNVFIATSQGLLEYAHGGASPIATIDVSANGCSVDRITGDLAVVVGQPGLILIYHRNAKGVWLLPRSVAPPLEPLFCGYDNQGNLFVDGRNPSDHFRFAELVQGRKAFTSIKLDQSITTPGEVQWDGRHITVDDRGVAPSVIYQFLIRGDHGERVGKTTLQHTLVLGQTWITRGIVIGPDSDFGEVELWKYPQGGPPIRTIALSEAYAATVSVAR